MMSTAPITATTSPVELLEFKSWILAQVERVSLCSEGLAKVQKYVSEEVDMDVKVIDTHLSPFNTRFRSAAHYESLPREATLFEEKYQELLQLIRGVLHEGADCFQTKKSAFQTQLKKIRDNANVAIRNAMQIERGESLFTCQKLRDDTEQQLKHAHEAHQQETGRLKELVQTLELTIGHLEQRIHVLQEKDQHRLTLQHEAVQEALRKQHQEHLQELQRVQSTAREDLQRLKDDYERRLDQAHEALQHQDRTHQQQLEAQRLQHQQEAQHHDQERQRAQDAYTALQTQMTLLKEKTQHTLQEERTLHEKSLSEQLAESLRVQAALKTDMATMIQQLHAAENKRRQDSELEFQRLRDQLTAQHAVDLDQRHEKHQRELKRLRAELDVHLEDQLAKVKHMHEQELQRQIRITDRLQRVLARHGLGSQAASAIDGLSSGGGSSSGGDYGGSSRYGGGGGGYGRSERPPYVTSEDEESFRRQLTPTRSRMRPRHSGGAAGASRREAAATTTTRESAATDSDSDAYGAAPPPPPPPALPLPQQRSTTGGGGGSSSSSSSSGGGLQWGALSRSLQQQQQAQLSTSTSSAPAKGPLFSPSHLPPSTFALDEALATTTAPPLPPADGPHVTSVAGNVRRMSSYLQALEDYLQGDETAAKDVDVSVATSTALSDILNVPLPLPLSAAATATKSDAVTASGGGAAAGANGRTATTTAAAAAAASRGAEPPRRVPASPSVSASLSSGSLTRFIEQFDVPEQRPPTAAGDGDGDGDGDLYVPSDSEDSLHRLLPMAATAATTASVGSRTSTYTPLLTTVLSDA